MRRGHIFLSYIDILSCKTFQRGVSKQKPAVADAILIKQRWIRLRCIHSLVECWEAYIIFPEAATNRVRSSTKLSKSIKQSGTFSGKRFFGNCFWRKDPNPNVITIYKQISRRDCKTRGSVTNIPKVKNVIIWKFFGKIKLRLS